MVLSAYNKHVQREMKAGRTMKQAAASWKSSNKKPSGLRHLTTSIRTRAAAKMHRSVSKTGKSKHRRSGFGTRGIFKILRITALAAPAVVRAVGPGTPEDKVKMAIRAYTGYNPYTMKLEPGALIEGYGPFVLTNVITWGIGKINSMIRRA